MGHHLFSSLLLLFSSENGAFFGFANLRLLCMSLNNENAKNLSTQFSCVLDYT